MCVIRALSLTVITASALTGMSPTKALIKSSHKHWVRIKGSQQELVEKVCCGFLCAVLQTLSSRVVCWN